MSLHAETLADTAPPPDRVAALAARLPYYPQRAQLTFLSFLAFVVVRYIQLGARMDILATLRFEFLVGIVVIIMVGIEVANRQPELGASRPILLTIGLLFFAMVVQLPFAADPVVARSMFNDRVIKFAFLTFFITVMVESPSGLRWFILAFLFSVFYVTLEATQGQISGGLVWENQGVMRLHGAVPIYGHPNSLSGVAMGSLPFILFLFPHTRRWWIRLGYVATLGTSMVCIVFTGSRTGYVGLIALILWWFFQSRRKRRFMLWMLVAGAGFVSVIPDQYVERFKSITGHEKEGHSRDARLEILKDAIVIFGEHPLGVGVASFPAVRLARFGRAQDTHNLYLEVGTNLGVQGLIIFLGLVGAMMVSLRHSMHAFMRQRARIVAMGRRRDLPGPLRKALRRHYQDLEYLEGMAKAVAGFILVRMVLGLFGMDLYEVYWWFGAGLSMSLAGMVVRSGRNTAVLADLVAPYNAPA